MLGFNGKSRIDDLIEPVAPFSFAPCRVIQTSRTVGGLLNLPIGGRQGPLLNGPLLGRSSPLRAPLGILKQPLFGGPSR